MALAEVGAATAKVIDLASKRWEQPLVLKDPLQSGFFTVPTESTESNQTNSSDRLQEKVEENGKDQSVILELFTWSWSFD